MNSFWSHTQRSIDELKRSRISFETQGEAQKYIIDNDLQATTVAFPIDNGMRFTIEPVAVPAEAVLNQQHPVFATEDEANVYINLHNLDAIVEMLENEQQHRIFTIKVIEPARHMTMGELMRKHIQPTTHDDPDGRAFLEKIEQSKLQAMGEAINRAIPPVPNVAQQLDRNGNAINADAMKIRQGYLSLLSTLSVEDARHINPDNLLKATMEHCDIEAILSSTFFKAGRQSTMTAVRRTIDFMLSTTKSVKPLYEGYVDKAKLNEERNKKHYKKDIDDMLLLLNNLIFVSKARVMMDDYPETISLSVQLLPSISEDETGEAMMKFEEILQEYKPKNLIELEVSITNKVVY